jgi:hypothetical protein
VKGAALALPRAAVGIYQVATHLPETARAVRAIAAQVKKDPVGSVRRAANHVVNTVINDPDKAAEFIGENLFFIAGGAAVKMASSAGAAGEAAAAAELAEAARVAEAAEAARAATRARVLANIAESRIARDASQFGEHALNDMAVQGRVLAETGDFATPYSRAIFYSGAHSGDAAKAFKLAKPGFMTIEDTRGGSALDKMKLYERLDPARSDEIWKIASKRFAEAAQGRVTIFDRYADPMRVFRTVEEPILTQSRRVWGRSYYWDY